MQDRRDTTLGWARIAGLTVSSLCGLYLLAVLVLRALWVMTDWNALACFDGDEPACEDPAPHESGLSAVRPSSWALATLGLGALGGSLLLALRMRQPNRLRAVLALSAGVVTVARLLVTRVLADLSVRDERS